MRVAGGSGNLGRLPVQINRPPGYLRIELREYQRIGAESVRLDRITADREVRLVDGLDEIRPRADQQIHAILMPEVVLLGIQIDALERRTHGAVENQWPLHGNIKNRCTHTMASIAPTDAAFNRISG